MKKIHIMSYIVFASLFAGNFADAQWQGRGRTNYWKSLDDDIVKNITIPVLFGVKGSDLSKNFGVPRDGGARIHEGLDIMAPKGTPIVSPTKAVVIRTGTGASAGNYVYTANPGGETFAYLHLDEIADLDPGDKLDVGDFIGTVGNTGNAIATAAHLHFEIRNDDDEATDPFPRLTKEWDTDDKVEYVEGAYDDLSSQQDTALSNLIVTSFLKELAGVDHDDLPKKLSKMLEDENITLAPQNSTTTTVMTGGSNLPLGVIRLGERSENVRVLQAFLINKNIGVSAQALAKAGTTGYFGPLTQLALMEYQRNRGITADGVYGPQTRTTML